MDMADYSEALDPAYTTLEFENMQVLPLGTGECARVQERRPAFRLFLISNFCFDTSADGRSCFPTLKLWSHETP